MMKRYLPHLLIACIFHILPISECMAICTRNTLICPDDSNGTLKTWCNTNLNGGCHEVYSCSCPSGYNSVTKRDNTCGTDYYDCEKAAADCSKPGACLNCQNETINTGVTGYTVTLSKQCQKSGNSCKCNVTARKYNCATEYYQSGPLLTCQYNNNWNTYSYCNGCSKCPDNSTCFANGFTCKSGYYESDGSCKECPKNYQTCNNDGFTCPKSTYKTDTECKACPTGATCDGSETFRCNSGFYKPQNSNSCTQCPNNATCNDGINFKCNDGFYKSGSSCASCPAYSTCTSKTDFTCNNGYCASGNKCEKLPDNAKCVDGEIKCYEDFYKSGNSCKACPASATCDGSTTFKCKSTYYKSGDSCKSCGSITIGETKIYATSNEGATSKSDCQLPTNTINEEQKNISINGHTADIKIKSCY